MAVVQADPAVYWEEEHNMFRESMRKFVEQEILPHHEQWEQDGQVPKEIWLKAGEQGFLCMDAPEEYGGLGITDFRYNQIVGEELVRRNAHGPGFTLQNDITLPYIVKYGSEEQKQKYIPKMVSGECIMAIAMTEPNTGSDLAGVKTSAIRKGDTYVINGQKTFITNGLVHDSVIVVAKTNPEERHSGITLFIVNTDMPGYEKGRKLEKMGLPAQDTAELYFKDVDVPAENMLGEEGQGFYYLMTQLARERLSVAVAAIAGAEAALDWTIKYCQERTAFGRPIGKFQNSRFKLAEMKTEVEIGRVFLNHCVLLQNRGDLTAEKGAMIKWWSTDMQNRVVDQCVQLHGGYGYMKEYPICKAYMDCRVGSIYAGTNEIMKEIIGRSMGF